MISRGFKTCGNSKQSKRMVDFAAVGAEEPANPAFAALTAHQHPQAHAFRCIASRDRNLRSVHKPARKQENPATT
jgi:hypothetical protein